MNIAYAAVAGTAILCLAVAAHAAAPLQLSDWQMQAVTAGGASASTMLRASVDGRNASIQTSLGNIAAESPHRSFAQSRTGALVAGAGRATVATDTLNQSAADGHGTAESATASTVGSANGDAATVRSVGATTAISASAGSSHSSVGVTESLANIARFGASGRSH